MFFLLQFVLGLRCSSLTSNPKRRQSQSELYTTHFDSEDDYRTVVETSVTVKNNSPIQDYVHPDDQTQPTFEMTPRLVNSWETLPSFARLANRSGSLCSDDDHLYAIHHSKTPYRYHMAICG